MKNILTIPLILLAISAFIGCDTQPETVKTKEAIKQVDTSMILINISLRRLGTMFKCDSLDKVYYQNVALYYKTKKEKYRLIANKSIDQYNEALSLYKRQEDSVTNKIIP